MSPQYINHEIGLAILEACGLNTVQIQQISESEYDIRIRSLSNNVDRVEIVMNMAFHKAYTDLFGLHTYPANKIHHSMRGYDFMFDVIVVNSDIKVCIKPKGSTAKSSQDNALPDMSFEIALREAFQAGNRRGYCTRSLMANVGATCKEPDEDEWIKIRLRKTS